MNLAGADFLLIRSGHFATQNSPLLTMKAAGIKQQFPGIPDAGSGSFGPMRKRGQNELPPSNTRRWTAARKAAVLEALRGGELTVEEACQRYALSIEELRAWERHFERHGVYGLRAKRIQRYRKDQQP